LILLVGVGLFWLIFETQSRASIAVSAMFGIWTLFFRRIKIKPVHVAVALVFPIVVLFFILYGSEIYGDVQIMGESFETGRIEIFQRIFTNNTLPSILFGNFRTFRFDNLHNSIAAIFATSGLLPTVAFLALMYENCRYVCVSAVSERQHNALAAILLLVVHSSMEAAVFTKGSVYAVMVSMLYIVAANRDDLKVRQK